jgi:O-acetyl-ADP-ribose deacetylase (regulator of RNase III)
MSENVTVGGSVIRLIQGDITDMDLEAFVYYAQTDLALGSGHGNAISTRGGPSIKKELDEIGGAALTEAVITSAGNLKAQHIVHAVGPAFQEDQINEKLKATIVNALKCADEKGIKQLAMPPMGAGFYGVPLPVCSEIMVDSIKDHLSGQTSLEEVVIVANDSRDYAPFEKKLASLS